MQNPSFNPGKNLEAKGDKKNAVEKYWDVARFGQMVDSHSRADMNRWMSRTLQSMAYQQLQAVCEKDGDHTEAAHFAYLATMFDPSRGLPERVVREMGAQDVAQWNALEVSASGLLMFIFAGCLVIAASILILRRQGTGPNDLRQASGCEARFDLRRGFVLSSAMLYVTYHPYAEILDGIIKLDSDTRHAALFDRCPQGR